MPRRVSAYSPLDGFGTLNLPATIGAGFLAAAMTVFVVHVLGALRRNALGRHARYRVPDRGAGPSPSGRPT
ncbi:hypothetical protein [Streptomyces misionensis]